MLRTSLELQTLRIRDMLWEREEYTSAEWKVFGLIAFLWADWRVCIGGSTMLGSRSSASKARLSSLTTSAIDGLWAPSFAVHWRATLATIAKLRSTNWLPNALSITETSPIGIASCRAGRTCNIRSQALFLIYDVPDCDWLLDISLSRIGCSAQMFVSCVSYIVRRCLDGPFSVSSLIKRQWGREGNLIPMPQGCTHQDSSGWKGVLVHTGSPSEQLQNWRHRSYQSVASCWSTWYHISSPPNN